MVDGFFSDVSEPIRFGGLASTDPLSFKVYEPDRHRPRQADGGPPQDRRLPLALVRVGRPRHVRDRDARPAMARPERRPDGGGPPKMAVAFEFIEKLGTPYYCFHDRDVAPEGASFAEFRDNLDALTDERSAIRTGPASTLLWGTANLFTHPRYQAGAATNPDPEVFAYAAAQVKHMLEVTKRLGGTNYVLWGGREGYDTLLNTDLKREGDQLARFLHLVAEHKHRIGFEGTLLIEPKPMEPTKHQYDYDVGDHPRLPCPERAGGRVPAQHRGQPRDARRPLASTTRSPTPWRTGSSAASTRTAATRRTAGTPTSSRTPSRTWPCRCTRS